MPEILGLTQEQKDRIIAARSKVTTAKSRYDSSLSELTKRDGKARSQWTSLMQCKGFLGKVKNYEVQDKKTCTKCTFNANCPDCQSKAECEARVIRFNNAYTSWSGYKSTVTLLLKGWNDAKTELNDLLESIKQQTLADPIAQAQIAAAAAGAAEKEKQAGLTRRTKYWLFGITVVVVGILLFVYWKFFRK